MTKIYNNLLTLYNAVKAMGGFEKFKEVSKVDFLKYLEENFPMHISEHEEDKKLKELCAGIMQGKNKGFNERAQLNEKIKEVA